VEHDRRGRWLGALLAATTLCAVATVAMPAAALASLRLPAPRQAPWATR